MQNNSGAIIVSIIVVVLVALGVWWYLQGGESAPTPSGASVSAPASGQLQGTVQ